MAKKIEKKASAKKRISKKPASKKTVSKKTQPVQKAVTNHAPSAGIHEERIQLLPPNLMADTIEGVTSLMNDFVDIANNNLTALQRRRKIGPGIRNYGFIEKVSDLAAANPQFAQFFSVDDMRSCIRNIEVCRDLAVLLQSFARAVTNTLLIYSDDAYGMALIYYNMVKEMSRRGDPTAMELFRTLRTFFKRSRQSADAPTQNEIEKGVHALMRGTADGKIVIENERPRVSAGKRVLVDEVKRGRAAAKETKEAEIDE